MMPIFISIIATVVFMSAALPSSSIAGSPEAAPGGGRRTVDVTYHFTVRDVAAGAKEVAAWVPIPPSNAWQTLEETHIKSDLPHTTVTEAQYGNQYLRFDLTKATGQGGKEVAGAVTFRVTRRAGSALELPSQSLTDDERERYLAPDKLVPIDGKIAKEAATVAGDAGDPMSKARRLYDHIVSSMKYDKSGTGWGRGDALYACDVRAGNCTDFHSLFIGEARSLEIPSRFVMGLSVPEDKTEGPIAGYHCWAEFYVDEQGWVPVDASEANKHPEKRETLFAGLDEHRVQFTMGRDIRLTGSQSEPLNYSLYAHVEVDGKPHPAETKFSFKNVNAVSAPAAAGG